MTTCRERGSGALSPAFYLLQAAGGYAIFADQALASAEAQAKKPE